MDRHAKESRIFQNLLGRSKVHIFGRSKNESFLRPTSLSMVRNPCVCEVCRLCAYVGRRHDSLHGRQYIVPISGLIPPIFIGYMLVKRIRAANLSHHGLKGCIPPLMAVFIVSLHGLVMELMPVYVTAMLHCKYVVQITGICADSKKNKEVFIMVPGC